MTTPPDETLVLPAAIPFVLEGTLPELGAGAAIELIQTTSVTGGRLERVMARTTTTAGGHFLLQGSRLQGYLPPTIHYTRPNGDTLNISYHLKLPQGSRTVKAIGPQYFTPVYYNIEAGSMPLSVGLLSSGGCLLFLSIPLVIALAYFFVGPKQGHILYLLASIALLALILQPLFSYYKHKEDAWAKVVYTVDETGQYQFIFNVIKDKELQDVMLSIRGGVEISGNLQDGGKFNMVFDKGMVFPARHCKAGEQFTMTFKFPEDVPALQTYWVSLQEGGKELFYSPLNLFRTHKRPSLR